MVVWGTGNIHEGVLVAGGAGVAAGVALVAVCGGCLLGGRGEVWNLAILAN